MSGVSRRASSRPIVTERPASAAFPAINKTRSLFMRKQIQLGAAALLLGLAAASSAAPTDLVEREQAAREASQAFLQELGGALKQQVEKGGPASAVPVCSEIAPGIASKLSRAHGWQVKRVGTRVRNPMIGTPDVWEQKVLAQFAKRAARGEKFDNMTYSEVVKEPNGQYFRFAKAIGVQPQCVGCHGAKDQLAPQVADTLARDYPHDQATGYKPGELRGAVSIKQPVK
jgi:cytochrome c553